MGLSEEVERVLESSIFVPPRLPLSEPHALDCLGAVDRRLILRGVRRKLESDPPVSPRPSRDILRIPLLKECVSVETPNMASENGNNSGTIKGGTEFWEEI